MLDYLGQFDAELLQTSEGRRVLTRLHPKLFALVYLLRHLVDEQSHVSFGEVHDDWFTQMESWIKPVKEPREWRRAFVAPRSCGKSTVWFLIAPLWAGAHGFARFVAAFADSATQAETHLATFKSELSTNQLLRNDFPELCSAAKRAGGATEFDNRSLFKAKSGFVFAARGVDAASLGLKVGDQRPDVIICDDLEPSESNYSSFQADKRLSTLVNAILPLSERARVALVGTVTMPGSIIHQMVKTVTSNESATAWIRDEQFTCHYHPAIMSGDGGQERSIWPAKWPLEWLQSIRHTQSYRLNYANDPMAAEGVYWRREDFHPGALAAGTRTILAIDPAVTSKKNSDYTGLAIVTYSPSEQRCLIEHAVGVRLTGAPLARHVAALVQRYPHVRVILIETNAGGELWQGVFDDIPGVKVKTHFSSKSKEVRFADAMRHWQARRVLHHGSLPMLEEQAIAFPKVRNDDVIDAAVAGVHFFLKPEWERKVKASVSSKSYI